MRKSLVTVLGWVLVLLGLAALVLPGPGLLLLVVGLVVLSQEYDWAERRVEPVKEKAFAAAHQGVATIPRIVMSALGALCVMGIGVFWGVDPPVPSVGPLGGSLPFGGWATGSSILASGLVALVLLGYSIRRFRGPAGLDDRPATDAPARRPAPR